jgi:hypothetical protein
LSIDGELTCFVSIITIEDAWRYNDLVIWDGANPYKWFGFFPAGETFYTI